MVRFDHYTLNRARYIYGTKYALHSEQSKVYLCFKLSTAQWTVQGTFIIRYYYYTLKSFWYIYVRLEHYKGNSVRQIYDKIWAQNIELCWHIYGMNWALHSEKCKLHLCYGLSTTQWTFQGRFMVGNQHYTLSCLAKFFYELSINDWTVPGNLWYEMSATQWKD